MSLRVRLVRSLDWLDARPWPQFVGLLYVIRWLVVLPPTIIVGIVSPAATRKASMPSEVSNANALRLFVLLVIAWPLLETLVECSLPYTAVRWFNRKRGALPSRAWTFITISALMMVLLHLENGLGALIPSFVTGMFLAYCYAHFARKSFWRAFASVAVFHAGINIVGYAFILLGV